MQREFYPRLPVRTSTGRFTMVQGERKASGGFMHELDPQAGVGLEKRILWIKIRKEAN